ncbi:hypothetical protein GGD83_004117 [Rhodoblastus sphagnicola]|nr:glycosyltransferase [Rhodoblastus sphagnicola]MBB4200288.1 hypothetical protein [Rhodoblastus sphagnicola]
MARIAFVQCQVSQLDEPVYSRMYELDPHSVAVVYWNDYGFARQRIDPEIGIVPDLGEPGGRDYPKVWIDRSMAGAHRDILAAVLQFKPEIAVLSDQPQLARLRLAFALRRRGVRVVFRVDKNQLSERPRRGFALALERQVARGAFDALAPTSPLTSAYYAWPAARESVLFPYATNERKFAPPPEVRARKRAETRARGAIAPDAFVFVSATKFSSRESPWELVESYARIADIGNIHLLALGDGPLLPEIKRECARRGLDRVTFPGFVPFRDLQDYFFAADAYLHLVAVGPWEVSPQDALVAGLGLVTTETVGSASVFLRGALRRFLVPFGDRALSAARMRELAFDPNSAAWFEPARLATGDYTVDATARRWLEAFK